MWKYFLFGDIEYQMYFSSIYRSFPTSLVKKNGNWKEREKEIKINNKKPSFSFICFFTRSSNEIVKEFGYIKSLILSEFVQS